MFGGRISAAKSKSVYCLVLEDGQWQHGPELPVAVGSPIVAQIKSTIYLFEHMIKQLLKLDPESNTWIKQASLPDGDYSVVSMTSANNQLCVAGGSGRNCAWYIPETNSWCKGQRPLDLFHSWGSLVHHDYKIFYLGGYTHAVEDLCIETGTWSVSSIKLPVRLQCHQALMLDVPQQE